MPTMQQALTENNQRGPSGVSDALSRPYESIIPSPFEVMRKLGLNVPDWSPSIQGLAEFLPGAGMVESQRMGADLPALRESGDYGGYMAQALGAAGMAGSELLPGLFGATARKGIKAAMRGIIPDPKPRDIMNILRENRAMGRPGDVRLVKDKDGRLYAADAYETLHDDFGEWLGENIPQDRRFQVGTVQDFRDITKQVKE